MTAKSEKTEKRIEEAITAETTALAHTETDAPKEVSVQDHITVVIPYCKEFAQGRGLLFALRSWQHNVRFGINIVVIGDREDWFSDEITFIEHERISDNAQVDTLAKLRIAVESVEVT